MEAPATDESSSEEKRSWFLGPERLVGQIPNAINLRSGRCEFGSIDECLSFHSSPPLILLPLEGIADRQTLAVNRDHVTSAASCLQEALAKGSSVCFLMLPGFHCEDVSLTDSKGIENYHKYRSILIGYRFLCEAGARMEALLSTTTRIRALRGEFKPFFDKFGAADYRLVSLSPKDEPTDLVTIGEAEADGCVALTRPVSGGNIFWVPMRRPITSAELQEAARMLSEACLTYVSKAHQEEPAWAKTSFEFHGEARLRRLRNRATGILAKIGPLEEEFSVVRRTLWTRDIPFQRAVVDLFLRMGFEVDHHDSFRQDFYLLDSGKPAVLGEAMAINGNVRQGDIGDVLSHRRDSGLDDSFPALLVARTLASEQGVAGRRIEPRICRIAQVTHVLVMRVIDLAHLYNAFLRGTSAVERTLKTVRASGGWLEVTPDGDLRTHTD